MERGKIIGNLNASYDPFEWRTVNVLLKNGFDVCFMSSNSSDKRIMLDGDIWEINNKNTLKEIAECLMLTTTNCVVNVDYLSNHWEKAEVLMMTKYQAKSNKYIVIDENNFWFIDQKGMLNAANLCPIISKYSYNPVQ